MLSETNKKKKNSTSSITPHYLSILIIFLKRNAPLDILLSTKTDYRLSKLIPAMKIKMLKHQTDFCVKRRAGSYRVTH